MQQEKRTREMGESNTIATQTDNISMLQGELFAERKNREETYDKIIKRLGNDVLRVNDILNNEKKVDFRSKFKGQRRDSLGIIEVIRRYAFKYAPSNISNTFFSKK